MAIYISKKNGASYTLEATSKNADGKNVYILSSVDDPTDGFSVAESTFKRWYKKSTEVEVDFTSADPAPADSETLPPADEETTEDTKAIEAPASKPKKAKKNPAKSYEEQVWGLPHSRLSLETFCQTFDINTIEYNTDARIISFVFNGTNVSRRINFNELTGSIWFRFKNAEWEFTDVQSSDKGAA